MPGTAQSCHCHRAPLPANHAGDVDIELILLFALLPFEKLRLGCCSSREIAC